MQSKGVRIISDVSEVPEDYEVVIRAHGVTKQTVESLDKAGISYTDATFTCLFFDNSVNFQHIWAGGIGKFYP